MQNGRNDYMDFTTVKGEAEASFIEKKSEFIGYISHAETPEEAVAYIDRIRSMHRKATHNVYAYILRNDNTSRYSDDGEPQGTAGVPVLEVLRKEGLTDICCVVTRYFGGILLGGGGLVRAYSHSAKIAVDAAVKMEMRSCFPFTVRCSYDLYGKINYILPEFEVKLLNTDFGADVSIELLCRTPLADDLEKKLIDTSNGRIELCKGDEEFRDFAE